DPTDPDTIADGIAVGTPIYGGEALAAVRRSGGGFVAVSDDDLLAAMGMLAARAGVLAEPAGAAAFAGGAPAPAQGLIRPGDRVVVLVTGSALKSPGFVAAALAAASTRETPARETPAREVPPREAPTRRAPALQSAGALIEIPADLDALQQALDRLHGRRPPEPPR